MKRDGELHSGKINPLLMVLLLAGVAVAGLVYMLPRGSHAGRDAANDRPLVMLVAAGLRDPVEQILAQYKEEYGVEVEVQYGGSNMLLNQLKVNKFEQPDLYLAADAFYTAQAVEEGLAAEVIPLAQQEPVIAFPKGKSIKVGSWKELFDAELRWSVADPDQAAIGRTLQNFLGQYKSADTSDTEKTLWDRLADQTTDKGVFKPTVNEVANDVKINAVDAGIVWNSTVAAPSYKNELDSIRFVELKETANANQIGDVVSVAVLTSTTRPTVALRLARYIGAADRGLKVFEEFGMTPLEGDGWSEKPEINFYCGAVNRRAIEPILEEFQKREGVVINTVYDGCGILTSRMGAIEGQSIGAGFPDFYMACDRYYLDNVQDWFQEDVNVSQTEIVLVVPKGSDKVQKLEDLIRPGVRVSVGEPNQCTIGALTRRLLQQSKLYDQLKEKQLQEGEVVVEKSSSALIVPDVVTGHVDVAVAYRNDVMLHEDKVDVLPIDSPLTKAVQPLSIARNSRHKQLVRRLYRQIEESGERFESAGFEFLLSR